MDKKIYYLDIDEFDSITGMNAIALVDHPAVEKNFLCFNEQKPIELKFDSSEHIITGVVALADTPIYRKTGDMEYYVVFSKQLIKKMIKKYARQELYNSINLQHDEKLTVKNTFMVESYIINKDRNIVPEEFKDVPDGSWIASFYVDSDALWDEIKNGNRLNGFSLQGSFELIDDMVKDQMNSDKDSLDDMVKSLISD